MTDLIKKEEPSFAINKGKLTSKASPFHQRMAQAKASEEDASKMPNRIALMLDCSSSMSGEKIELLKQAIVNFAQRCNFSDTAIAIETFPKKHSMPLSVGQSSVAAFSWLIEAGGDTPLRDCVQRIIESVSLTRGVVVSDGEATDWHTTDWDECPNPSGFKDTLLQAYCEQQIPLDCVHIGDSESGEKRLRDIAKQTGGLYIKFKDVSAFSTAFAYLTPGLRGMLMSGSMSSESLGADEVRK